MIEINYLPVSISVPSPRTYCLEKGAPDTEKALRRQGSSGPTEG